MLKQEKGSLYQPDQEGLIFPEEPQFETIEEERHHLKIHLAAACRFFHKCHFDYGFAGHLTIRDPERPELYWTNPMAVPFSKVCVSNLILADHKGKVIEGNHAINQAGFILHGAVHEEHPDILAMCHAHTVYGTAWAATGRELDPITQDAAAFYEDHVVIADEGGKVAVEAKAGYEVSRAFGNNKAAIHQNHGLLTASRHSIDAAAFWFSALERCCQQQLLVEASGIKPKLVPPDKARYTHKHVGSEYIGWLHFQTIFDEISTTQPDLYN
ncbi:MAG: class II aldolase/adducin family protein [Verrucomicrobia bacterium]|nr:class II aldolase/adducin family protein [Verrucomicrobiota bacterium]